MMQGIDVGHQFFSRAEMVVVGFHQHWLNGIDYIGETACTTRKSGKKLVYLNPVQCQLCPHAYDSCGLILKDDDLLRRYFEIEFCLGH